MAPEVIEKLTAVAVQLGQFATMSENARLAHNIMLLRMLLLTLAAGTKLEDVSKEIWQDCSLSADDANSLIAICRRLPDFATFCRGDNSKEIRRTYAVMQASVVHAFMHQAFVQFPEMVRGERDHLR